ncbi:efflux RND transporter periplasmic adaptor subunit [Phaeovulum vinaykumarii]|uniref:HlyD family secretion protein n=1 Tax=Phaeovulum vinaykumarii TaxID=407234 RepID=A0A1N7KUR1_9RHOB|nr:HlyD family efflux transporter periplasmic adaptor subunit [Phaeovulum vinaykumarii]SIS65236.1 HlyD family secretion protein [Phaeovulum vinaykumarii]SOC01354.1 HlyD family secretion protein [Phaeovulum vinaykumarii]
MPFTARRLSRPFLILSTLVLVGGVLAWAFRAQPVMVDLGQVSRGPLALTIDEDGRTRVRDSYVVSTPVEGRLLRVTLRPGDPVTANSTVLARMRPTNPAVLDVRTREQARAAVAAAEAGLEVARADLEAAEADLDLAEADRARARALAGSGTVSQAALDRAESAARAAEARRHTARAAIAQRQAELQTARAQLIGFEDRGLVAALEAQLGDEIPILSPIDGRVLRVIQEDETILPAGAPLLEVGNVAEGLEVVVELLSADAVRVRAGDPVRIEEWGGPAPLAGTVERIEPFGITKTSALGVEEQRVTAVVRLDSPAEARAGLGHGYRVEARIVIWQAEAALKLPSGAVVRGADGPSVFVMQDGRAERRAITLGPDNGIEAAVTAGLAAGETVVLYPPAGLRTGDAITRRVVD